VSTGAPAGGSDLTAQLYAGTYQDPPTHSPKPAVGKSIWIISYLQTYTSSATTAAAAQKAAQALGWNATVFDAKGDPATAVNGIRQAIAAKASAIFAIYWDCSAVKAGLLAAKSAGIVTMADEASDCPGNPLYNYIVSYNSGVFPYNDGGFLGYLEGWEAVSAQYIIASTSAHAKVIDFDETDIAATVYQDKGFRQQMATCGGCKIVDTVTFTGADLGPALQQKAQQAFLQHPDANAVVVPADAILTGGVLAAMKSAGKYGSLVIGGGEGGPDLISAMKAYPGHWGFSSLPIAWEGWQAVDAANRLFNGQQPIHDSGMGYQIVDKTRNTPPGNEMIPFKNGQPIDFAGVYTKAWTSSS
jgi:ribose transport system substrate-binding protein